LLAKERGSTAIVKENDQRTVLLLKPEKGVTKRLLGERWLALTADVEVSDSKAK
jgi:hypothetical protein